MPRDVPATSAAKASGFCFPLQLMVTMRVLDLSGLRTGPFRVVDGREVTGVSPVLPLT